MCNTNQAPRHTSWYASIFARLYDPFMEKMEEKILRPRRRALLEPLSGNVLEVGAGTGINLPLYASRARVLAIEPSVPMLRKAQERLQDAPIQAEVRLLHAGVGDNFPLPEKGFDAVVCTLVLCTIPRPDEALQRIKSMLTPGGKLVILEHIAARHTSNRFLQKLINPCWKHVAEGCHLTRDTDKRLRQHGFLPEGETYFTKGLRFYQASGTFPDR